MSHKIIPITDAPKRQYKKGSVYDGVIKSFIDGNHTQARIEMTKKKDGQELNGTYLAGRLQKRIRQRIAMDKDHELYLHTNEDGDMLSARTINGKAYLLYEEPRPLEKSETE